jgi:hypothetical protein
VREVALAAHPPADPRVAANLAGIGIVPPGALGIGLETEPGLPEEAAERLSVPQLLVDPTRQERGDVGFERSLRRQQVAQEDDGVGFDVHHVGETARLFDT